MKEMERQEFFMSVFHPSLLKIPTVIPCMYCFTHFRFIQSLHVLIQEKNQRRQESMFDKRIKEGEEEGGRYPSTLSFLTRKEVSISRKGFSFFLENSPREEQTDKRKGDEGILHLMPLTSGNIWKHTLHSSLPLFLFMKLRDIISIIRYNPIFSSFLEMSSDDIQHKNSSITGAKP